MRVSAGTTIAEQDCQVLDLSGRQELAQHPGRDET